MDGFEVNMYTNEMNNAITTTRWFYNLFIHFENETIANLLSRPEIAFLLHSGASISVPKYQPR